MFPFHELRQELGDLNSLYKKNSKIYPIKTAYFKSFFAPKAFIINWLFSMTICFSIFTLIKKNMDVKLTDTRTSKNSHSLFQKTLQYTVRSRPHLSQGNHSDTTTVACRKTVKAQLTIKKHSEGNEHTSRYHLYLMVTISAYHDCQPWQLHRHHKNVCYYHLGQCSKFVQRKMNYNWCIYSFKTTLIL